MKQSTNTPASACSILLILPSYICLFMCLFVCLFMAACMVPGSLIELEDRLLPPPAPPVWLPGYPSHGPVGTGTYIKVATDKPGKVYVFAALNTNSAMDADTLKAHAAIQITTAAETPHTIRLSNLQAHSDYAVWLAAECLENGLISHPVALEFTTRADTGIHLIHLPELSGFIMGHEGVAPLVPVAHIHAFGIASTETTYAAWTNIQTWGIEHGYRFKNPGMMGSEGSGTPQHPATDLHWHDALAWCNALSEYCGFIPLYYSGGAVYTDSRNAPAAFSVLERSTYTGYRLPLEHEWEYAARYAPDAVIHAGNLPAGYTGTHTNYEDAALTLDEWGPCAWYHGNSGSTHPVATKAPTASGLFDMSGNAQEWCLVQYTPVEAILRGGAYSTEAVWLRSAMRMSHADPLMVHESFGFRVLR